MPIERALNVLRTGLGVWSRVWRRNSNVRIQNEDSYVSINLARPIGAAKINASPWYSLRIASKVAVTGENGLPIVGIGNDQDIGFVISRAGNHPGFCLARIIGGAQVRIANTAAQLETAEFVFQKNIDHTCHRIAAINGRGAILQDVDVINHWERNEIDVNANSVCIRCDAFSIDENQSLFRQQTTQVWYDGAIPAKGDVLVDGRAHLLWQLREQVGCVVSAQFLNIFRAISIHGIRASLFRGRDVRTGNDDAFDFRRGTGRLGSL